LSLADAVNPHERRFDLPGISLAAAEWGQPGGLPVLALHGWLDNAGSFDRLAPLLADCHVIALDLAGHGASDFRSVDAAYDLWRDVGDVLDVAEQLTWPRMNLVGHSRGAAIAMLFAAAFPERVEKLVLLEGGIPLVGNVDDAPQTLAKGLLDRRRLYRKEGRVFMDRDTAIDERAGGFSKVSRAAAEILARRSLRGVAGGYQWRADQRLKGGSEIKLDTSYARAFVRRVTAPVLMILAEESPFADLPIYQEMIAEFPAIEVARLAGGHHFHLESAAPEIARRIRLFLA
jgi:pimeloyl-ACP methyl ester carboxylesterase